MCERGGEIVRNGEGGEQLVGEVVRVGSKSRGTENGNDVRERKLKIEREEGLKKISGKEIVRVVRVGDEDVIVVLGRAK